MSTVKVYRASLYGLNFAHGLEDAGADICSAEATVVKAGERAIVHTGLYLSIPTDMVGLVHPRSGLAAKKGITVLNTPGTIDAGYRGELMVILFNSSHEDFEIQPGDRIAQIVFQKVEHPLLEEVETLEELGESDRKAGGLGSTGV